jgi:hypothetical protein
MKRTPVRIDDLPLFAAEDAIAAVFMGPGKTAQWRQVAALLEGRGLPKIEPLMGGRYVPAIKAFFDSEYNITASPPLAAPDGPEALGTYKTRKTHLG